MSCKSIIGDLHRRVAALAPSLTDSHTPVSVPQRGRGQVSGHTVRLCDVRWTGAQLQAHPGGHGVHAQHLQLPVRRPEVQPHLPELATHQ